MPPFQTMRRGQRALHLRGRASHGQAQPQAHRRRAAATALADLMFAVPDIGTSARLTQHPARVLLHFCSRVAQARRISAAKVLIFRTNRLGTSDALALMRALKAW